MIKPLQPIHEILQLHINLFKIATGGISEDEAHKQVNGKGNPMIHLAGHIVSSRYYMGALVGLKEENPLEDLYQGTYDPDADHPSMEHIVGLFNRITPKLLDTMQGMSEDELDRELPQPFPTKNQNILAGLSFLAEHEGYHIGQMGYIRVQLGHKSIYDTMFENG